MLRKLKKILNKKKTGLAQDSLTEVFRLKYEYFKELLDSNAELSKIVSELEEKLRGDEVFGMAYLKSQSARAVFHSLRMITSFNALSDHRFPALLRIFEEINAKIREELENKKDAETVEWILPYTQVTRDTIDRVGGKNANLGEIQNRVGLPIPPGFAITTGAFEHFLSENDLFDQIAMRKLQLDANDAKSIESVAEQIQRLIISAPVPAPLREAILGAYDALAEAAREQGADEPPRIAMRSSALGEDSELSFAGQYLSVLNVPRDRIIKVYSLIVASLFTPRAISYRLMKGIPDVRVAMSVACIGMVDSVASGVMYSRHPIEAQSDDILISAVWGLGPYAVEGTITPDGYRVARTQALDIVEKRVAEKPVKLVSNPEGGLQEKPSAECELNTACLSEEQIRTLAGWALRLEEHYGVSQDIEWALDAQGRFFILQARPLCAGPRCQVPAAPIPTPLNHPVLVDSGAVASPGIGCGKAFRLLPDRDLADFPEGAILVAPQPSPRFMVIMPKARAIVTDFGSITGHMASLAREFSVPALLDTRTATSAIDDGREITVDAYSGKVYDGIVPELLALQGRREPYMKGTPVYETLLRIAALITPLRLFNPQSPDFTPENCRSLHDLMRFIHELSYVEMFRISDLVSDHEGVAFKLDAPIPLDLHIIDLGGGLAADTEKRKVKPDQVVSVPFRALLAGMLHEDLLVHHPKPVQLKGFLSVMSEQMFSPAHSGAERFGDRSYAIISDRYLNFSSRVGYHYGVLDSYCGKTLSKNYITFSFKGGAADDLRKNRRARAIGLILEALGLTVSVVGDRVDAKLQKLETPLVTEKLDLIGRLLQFTRQMDMLMESEASVNALAKAFLEENYHI